MSILIIAYNISLFEFICCLDDVEIILEPVPKMTNIDGKRRDVYFKIIIYQHLIIFHWFLAQKIIFYGVSLGSVVKKFLNFPKFHCGYSYKLGSLLKKLMCIGTSTPQRSLKQWTGLWNLAPESSDGHKDGDWYSSYHIVQKWCKIFEPGLHNVLNTRTNIAKISLSFCLIGCARLAR